MARNTERRLPRKPRDLESLERFLKNEVGTGDELSSDQAEQLVGHAWKKTQARLQLRERLRVAQRTVEEKRLTLPELFAHLRRSARASVDEIACAAHLAADDVERIESGSLDTLTLAPETLVMLMEVFSMPLSVFERCAQRLVATRSRPGAGVTLPVARSGGTVPPEAMEKALRDVMELTGGSQKAGPTPGLPSGYLEKIRTVLHRWGRTDLL